MKTPEIFPGSSKLIEGNFPESSILLMGPTGIGKTIFSKQFVFNGLLVSEPGIYISTEESPEMICKSMNEFGFDIKPFVDNDMFRIIDCYSWKLEKTSSSKYAVSNPSDLLKVLRAIDDARNSLRNFRLVLDSITGLTSICEHSLREVVRFLQLSVANIRESNGNAIFIAVPEAHDPQLISNLRLVFDGILEMKMDDSENQLKRLFRVFSLKGAKIQTTWTRFEITSKGIELKRDNQLRCEMCSAPIEWEPIVEKIAGENHTFDKEDCVNDYKKLKEVYGEDFK
jgi:KaiC/GvpD/RAD55 family RecA-like ATPase